MRVVYYLVQTVDRVAIVIPVREINGLLVLPDQADNQMTDYLISINPIESHNLSKKFGSVKPSIQISIFYSVFRPFQDYFSSYETGKSVGGAKAGEPREKPPGTPASRTWLVSHVARAGLEPTPDTAVR